LLLFTDFKPQLLGFKNTLLNVYNRFEAAKNNAQISNNCKRSKPREFMMQQKGECCL